MRAIFFALVLIWPSMVWPCGGLFCSQSPVDQNAERILFVVDEEEGIVTMMVQIAFSGRDEDFAWVLPLPAPQLVGMSSVIDANALLALDRMTLPQFIPRGPVCGFDEGGGCACGAMEADMVQAASGAAGDGVQVFAEEQIGPFDSVTIGAEDPEAVVTWLKENGYNITEAMEPLIGTYAAEGMVFFAMRLNRDASVQDIQPLRLSFPSRTPAIPLRLTQVAAEPHMGVLVFVLGSSRAVVDEASGFTSARVEDEALAFRPFASRNNYYAEVARTADAAGGRAFVTEMARFTAEINRTGDEVIDEYLERFPYLTRMYTRISPEEMTADPSFRFDPTQPQVRGRRNLVDQPVAWTCDGEPRGRSADPCAFIYCGKDGQCVESPTGEAACICDDGFVARPMIDPVGIPTVTCVAAVPETPRPEFVRVNPCFEDMCGNGECVNAGGVATCRCPDGHGAVAGFNVNENMFCEDLGPLDDPDEDDEDDDGCATVHRRWPVAPWWLRR